MSRALEYGSEFDLASNELVRGRWDIPESWQLFRSGRDALKAFARLAGRRRVLMPALCCDSMIGPFRQNGWEVAFYRLRADLTADEADLRRKLRAEDVLLYMPYFGIPAFSPEQLARLRHDYPTLLFLEDRTHDILVPRAPCGFEPDATAASLRKWAALPEGGMLVFRDAFAGEPDPRYGDLRLEAMEKKSRYLQSGDESPRFFIYTLVTSSRLALPEEPFGIALFLRFFDRCGNCGFALSAPAAQSRNSPAPCQEPSGSSPVSKKSRHPPMADSCFLVRVRGLEPRRFRTRT